MLLPSDEHVVIEGSDNMLLPPLCMCTCLAVCLCVCVWLLHGYITVLMHCMNVLMKKWKGKKHEKIALKMFLSAILDKMNVFCECSTKSRQEKMWENDSGMRAQTHGIRKPNFYSLSIRYFPIIRIVIANASVSPVCPLRSSPTTMISNTIVSRT